jgi:hypothetical protein
MVLDELLSSARRLAVEHRRDRLAYVLTVHDLVVVPAAPPVPARRVAREPTPTAAATTSGFMGGDG